LNSFLKRKINWKKTDKTIQKIDQHPNWAGPYRAQGCARRPGRCIAFADQLPVKLRSHEPMNSPKYCLADNLRMIIFFALHKSFY
jgi:hypothetical protein